MMDLSAYSTEDLKEILRQAQAAKLEADKRLTLEGYKPYPKQLLFHEHGARYLQRLLSAGNQQGKTYCGGAEVAYHLTGRYPPWWKGHMWTRPTVWLAGSESGELTRDGMQRILLGPPTLEDQWGTGLIPAECIAQKPKRRPGIKDAVDAIVVEHKQGGQSVIRFKSFDQGRSKWQADTVDGIWLDEEPPYDVYEEAVTRTNATNGIIMITFTPLKGMSRVVRSFFLEPGNNRIVVQMSLEDALHYTPERRAEIEASYDDATRDARVRGVPVLGSGLVFPVKEELIKCDPFEIPDHWPRIGAIDFGWDHPTGAVNLAWDRDADTLYQIREHRQSRATIPVHAAVLRQWGAELPWVWPHDGHKAESGSGEQLAAQYRTAGLRMAPSHVTFEDGSIGVEAGVQEMLTRMTEGRFKVFSTCPLTLQEISLYHRKDGLIVKLNDDLISAARYGMMGRRFAKTGVGGGAGRRRRNVVATGAGEARL